MGDEYGRMEWQTDEAAATAEAVRRIEAAITSGATVLDFSDLIAMTRLPDELAKAQGVREIHAGMLSPDHGRQHDHPNLILSDISVLTKLVGLAKLDLSFTRVSDATPLADLVALTNLNLSHTGIIDATPLSGLVKLTTLNLSGTGVTDLTPLSGLLALTSLNLNFLRVMDATPLSGLSRLTSLDLSFTRIKDVTPLSGLARLTELSLCGTPITDVTPLYRLLVLTSLDLSDTSITDAALLSGLLGLTSLDLSHMRITDATPLSNLVRLNALKLRASTVRDLGFLLSLPEFAAERGIELSYQDTPALRANPQLYRLSRLPPDRCAIETVQYLKGTHPDFGAPEVRGNETGKPIAAILALASPIAIGRVGDQLEAINPGTPQRVNPLEAGQRVEGLRRQVALIRGEALHTQCGPAVLRRLESYAESLAADPPIFFVMDAPMQMLRGSLDDSYLMEAVDKGLEQGLRGLVDAHDALRPFLLPPSDEEAAAMDAMPPLNLDVTPDDVAGLAHQALDALSHEDIRDKVGPQLVSTLKAIEDLAVTWKDRSDNPSFLRKIVAPFGGTLSVLADAISVHAWWLGPTGVLLAARIQPLLEKVLGWFQAAVSIL